ncbi:MAG: hypothetical protein FJW97_00095 [Actinobacteria bacterium]|nr:hypothetical protein [Actinomycetota bacterium]
MAQRRAMRVSTPRWTDFRLWLGLALVVGAMFAGAHLLSSDGDDVTVWQATRDLPEGAVIADLRPVTVSLGDAGDDYLAANDVVTGRMLWPVSAGELIPRRAVVAGDLAGARLVTMPVDPLRLPPDLMPGDRVDVWATPSERAEALLVPQLIVPGVTVASISEDTVGIGGQIAVVLTVAEADVAEVVAASRGGGLDLVSVPLSSQRPRDGSLVEAADALS